jgi:serine/threonine protein phosphatase PrpC
MRLRHPLARLETFAGIVVCGATLCVAHVGDSRVYLLRRSKSRLVQLTHDDTVLGDALRRGERYEVAASRPDAHALTRMLGATSGVEVEPIVVRWEPGDSALLCTDGVSDRVEAAAMADILLDAGEVSDAARRIIDRASEAGGYDNATVLLVRASQGTEKNGRRSPA